MLSADKIYIIGLILVMVILLFIANYFFIKKIVSDELHKKKRSHKKKYYKIQPQQQQIENQRDLDSYVDPVEQDEYNIEREMRHKHRQYEDDNE